MIKLLKLLFSLFYYKIKNGFFINLINKFD